MRQERRRAVESDRCGKGRVGTGPGYDGSGEQVSRGAGEKATGRSRRGGPALIGLKDTGKMPGPGGRGPGRHGPALIGSLAVGLALAGLAASGCDRGKGRPESSQHPNVLLIVVDTLRADKVGCQGSTLGLTPEIDAAAAGGVRFGQAYSQAPWTLPSVASLLTSTSPAEHGAGGSYGQPFRRLPDSARTLAECFRDAGYATGAIINVLFLGKQFGMNQGIAERDFDYCAPADNLNERRAGPTTDAAVRWMSKQGKRSFFLMVHYFDPHLVYDPPKEYRERLADPRDRQSGQRLFGTVEDMVALRANKTTLTAETIRRLERLYNGEVAYTDRELGRLLAELDKLGLADSTIVVITADHGEEFLDHGGFEHGHTQYDELLHVPLIWRWSGRLRPAVVETTVRHIDVAPTLCELAGVAAEPKFGGQSLAPLLEGKTGADRPALSEGNLWGPNLVSWRHGGYKLIQGAKGAQELYGLESDPGEKRNLADVEPQERDRMAEELTVVLKSVHAARGAPAVLSPQELQTLRANGYVTRPAETAEGKAGE